MDGHKFRVISVNNVDYFTVERKLILCLWYDFYILLWYSFSCIK